MLAAQLLLQQLDVAMVPLVPPLEALLIGHGQQQLGSGIMIGMTPAFHLLGEQAPLAAVGAQFRGVQAPVLRILLGSGHHRPLQPPSPAPLVEGYHNDAQLLGDLSQL